MAIADLIERDGEQIVILPDGFEMSGRSVGIKWEGDTIVLTPTKSRVSAALEWLRTRRSVKRKS